MLRYYTICNGQEVFILYLICEMCSSVVTRNLIYNSPDLHFKQIEHLPQLRQVRKRIRTIGKQTLFLQFLDPNGTQLLQFLHD
jgi:hypothetical protein